MPEPLCQSGTCCHHALCWPVVRGTARAASLVFPYPLSVPEPTVRGSASQACVWRSDPAPDTGPGLAKPYHFRRFVLYTKINFYTPSACTPCPASPGEQDPSPLLGLREARGLPWLRCERGDPKDLGCPPRLGAVRGIKGKS